MAQVLSQLHDLVAEFGRDMLNEQANMSSELLKRKIVEIKKLPGEVGTVQVKRGGNSSIGSIVDGGTRKAAASVDFVKGTYNGVVFEGAVLFPIQAVRVARGGRGVDLFKEQMESASRDMWRQLNRAMIGSKVGSPAASVSAAATTFTISDPAGIKPGCSLDVYSSAGGTFIETIVVSDVTIPASGNSTVTMAACTAAWTTSYVLYLRGAGASASRLASFEDCNSSSTTLYGLTTAQSGTGEDNSTVVSWTNEDGGAMIDMLAIRSGERPTHIVCNSRGRRKIANAQTSNVRFQSGKMDPYGLDLEFDGLGVVVDENYGSKVIDFINNKLCYMHEFYPIAPDNLTGGGSGSESRAQLILDNATYNYKLPISGSYELVFKQRNAFGRFSAIAD